jgi:hypothetical protein
LPTRASAAAPVAREKLPALEPHDVVGRRLADVPRNVGERALDLIRLALHAEDPHADRTQDVFVNAGDVLTVEPDEILGGAALADQLLTSEQDRRAAILRNGTPRPPG